MCFTAESGPDSTTGWRGRGAAAIVPERIDGDRRLVERGRFRAPGAARPIAFHNVYRWRLLADGLALSHERFGADAPVFLFDLVEADDRRLITRTAHRCGADIYDATLTSLADGFTLDWTIHGPAKDERLYYRYALAHKSETEHGQDTMTDDNTPRITLCAVDRAVSVRYGGQTIAVTDAALCLTERGCPPRLYFPPEAITGARLIESATRTHCPFKGDATYFDLMIGTARLKDAAWSYAQPMADVAEIKGHIALDHPAMAIA